MLRASPLMAIHLQQLSTVQAVSPIHPRHQFEKYHQLMQATDAKVTPVVDHLLVSAPVKTFVSFEPGVLAGVRVSADTHDATEHVVVNPHNETGIEITATSGSVKHEHVLVEVFLPTPNALRDLQCDCDGLVVVEGNAIPTTDPYAQICVRQSGKSKVLMSSLTGLDVASLCLESTGNGILQLVAPTITLHDQFHVNASALGSVRVFTDKLNVGGALLETAGCSKVQVDARQLEVATTMTASASRASSLTVKTDVIQADQLSMLVHGKSALRMISTELIANGIECVSHGAAEITVECAKTACKTSRLIAHGVSALNCYTLAPQHTFVEAHGLTRVHFRATESATTNVHGAAQATIHSPLPSLISGRATASADVNAAARHDKLVSHCVAPIALPLRSEVFETTQDESTQGIFGTLKSIFHGGVQDNSNQQPAQP